MRRCGRDESWRTVAGEKKPIRISSSPVNGRENNSEREVTSKSNYSKERIGIVNYSLRFSPKRAPNVPS